MKNLKIERKSLLKLAAFVFAGGLLGYAYYYFIGCRTGTCPLSSNATLMTLYGSLFGVILGWPSKSRRRTARKEDQGN